MGVILCAAHFGPVQAGLTTGHELQHDGQTRVYDLFVPDTPATGPLPLVLDLHGYTSDRQQQRNFFAWDTVAANEGFLVAFPDALGGSWGAYVNRAGSDDLGFLRALVAEISANYDIDPDRIYATGFSQGGQMALRLACEAGDLFAAFASFAGPLDIHTQSQCDGALVAPVTLVMASNDDVVPYVGGVVNINLPVTVPGAEDHRDHWRDRNDCTGPLTRSTIGSVSYCDTDSSCASGAEVQLCTIRGSSPRSTHLLHDNVDNVPLAQRAWEFISRFENVELPPEFVINAGLNDAWYDPDTDGQGFLISVFPDTQQMFVAWFTYDVERPSDDVQAILGDPGHRWLTAQGSYDGDTATLTVYVTEGGEFDSAEPPAQNDGIADGHMTIEFEDCIAALVTYDLLSPGLSGEIRIQRILDDNVPLCEALSTP